MQTRPDFIIYPSLMIAYQNLLDYELIAGESWNRVSEASHKRGEYLDREIGDYKLTPDEMYLKLECDLLDAVNRVDGRYGEAAAKGTAFNEIVDCLIENRGSRNPDVRIRSCENGQGERVIRAETEGYTFDYDVELCRKAAERFKGSLTQYPARAMMETAFGLVELYGYADEWVGDEIGDIKTTGSYTWPKYEKGWQRHVYPWCAVESGDSTDISRFTYYVVEWAYQRQGEPLKAKSVYEEAYTYDHEESGRKIREMLESFIPWLLERREQGLIQDKKIFGGWNPEGWSGKPTSKKKLERILFSEPKESKSKNTERIWHTR